MDTQPLQMVAAPSEKRQDASEELPQASTGTQAPGNGAQETAGKRRVLIVPKGCDEVIKQKMVNIFQPNKPVELPADASKPTGPVGEAVAQVDQGSDAKNDLGLDVKSTRWSKGHKEPKQVKPNADTRIHATEVQQPDDWGKTEYLQPSLQCPPKKRGPKAKPVEAEGAEQPKPPKAKAKAKGRPSKKGEKAETPLVVEEVKAPQTRKRGKCSPEIREADPEAESKSGDGATGSGADERLRKHLHEAKEAKKRRKAAISTQGSEIPESKEDPEAKTSEEVEATDQEGTSPKTQTEKQDAPVEPKPKRSRKAQQAAPAAQSGTSPADPAAIEADEKAAKKKKMSRKSSAYHTAFRACQGSLEEKKAAAKKVS